MRKILQSLVIPLSILPLVAAGLVYVQRHVDRNATAAPTAARSPDCRRMPAPGVRNPVAMTTASHPDGVPVIAYHGIALHGRSPDGYTVTRDQLARQLAALRASGYTAISAATYLRFASGEPVRMPAHPILITFDDGDASSYCGADAILRHTGLRAVMFAIAGRLDTGCTSCLTAAELRRMRASGRWDVAFHAGWGHVQVRAAQGGLGAFYATREPRESLAHWRARVVRDLEAGGQRLARLVPGAQLRLFAVPYSDVGQEQGQDPRIRRALAQIFRRRFEVSFIQEADPPFARRGEEGYVDRFEIRRGTTATDLLRWLRADSRRAGVADGRGAAVANHEGMGE
ncbi:MAG TPA: polysaccharide deacetylase family protein [Solirubrobacteraceae bacterium]|nr:polysaccharide deacetylase family protein [Solirubrobacteraceae bacterium]